MFSGCTSLVGAISYSPNKTDATYANYTTGYFTLKGNIDEENVTGIVNVYGDERKATETYDLSGRRLPAGSQQKGLVIRNGKVVYNK